MTADNSADRSPDLFPAAPGETPGLARRFSGRTKQPFPAPDLSVLERPVLIVTVDTEEDFDWSAPFSADSISVRSMERQELGQRVMERYGIKPIYLCDYPIADQEPAYSILREWRENGRCEIGTQLHPWVNPPHREVVNERNSYPCNLPLELAREKLKLLTDRIEQTIGGRNIVYKAGRSGASSEIADLLMPLGYKIDMSFNPTRDYAQQGGPDHTSYPHAPFWLDAERQLLSIPLSADVLGPLRHHWMKASALLWSARSEQMHLPGALSRLGLVNRVTLTPEGVSLKEAKQLTRSMLRDGHRVFCLCYHSPSLLPGGTPYVRTPADLDRFIGWLDGYFNFFRSELDGVGITPTELYGLAHRSSVILPPDHLAIPKHRLPPIPAASVRPNAKSTSLVSVVIPTFNRSTLVTRAVQSVLKQTYRPLEIIVIDDGSTDDTAVQIRQFGKDVLYFTQENSGVAVARNTGMRASRGDFVAFLDSDDLWEPWKLEVQMSAFARLPSLQIVYSDARAVDRDGSIVHNFYLREYLKAYRYFNEDELFEGEMSLANFMNDAPESVFRGFLKIGRLSQKLYMGNLILTPTAVFRRNLLLEAGEFDSSLGDAGEDYDFFCRLARTGVAGLVDVPTTIVSIGGADHLHRQSARMALANLRTMERMEQAFPNGIGLPAGLIRRRRRDAELWAGISLFDADQIGLARPRLLKALLAGNLQRRGMAYLLLSSLPISVIQWLRNHYASVKLLRRGSRNGHSRKG